MPKCMINGLSVEFHSGQTIFETAQNAGILIPTLCHHPALSTVSQCRMCAVEINQVAQLQMSCSTRMQEGMSIQTQSKAVIQNQKSILEFLLIHHPLDCPICDKSGECDLQDQSYTYGSSWTRYTEEKRTYLDLDMGPVIQKNMNRCIHCTRCIRFGSEIAGIDEMIALKKGNHLEISTHNGAPLKTEYAGNYSDICPTGALTLKDFRFKKRVWLLTKTTTLCEGCSRGCPMEIHHEGNIIARCMPRVNREKKQFWLCDEGRFNFHYIHHPNRIIEPTIQLSNGQHESSTWQTSIHYFKQTLHSQKNPKLIVLIGSDLTQEEIVCVQEFLATLKSEKHLSCDPITVTHYGTPQITTSQQDGQKDKILKRKSQTANLHGMERLGITGFQNSETFLKKILPKTEPIFLIIRGGRAVIPEILHSDALKLIKKIGIGIFNQKDLGLLTLVLPGLSFAEKSGTVFNCDNQPQHFQKALISPPQCKSLQEIFDLYLNDSDCPSPQNKMIGVSH